MTNYISKLRVGKAIGLKPFQKAILLSNRSLKEMFLYIQDKYSSAKFTIQYLLTDRLNQNISENFFCYIGAMGALNTKPSALQLKHRIKWYMLGKHCPDVFNDTGNTRPDDDCTFVGENGQYEKNVFSQIMT